MTAAAAEQQQRWTIIAAIPDVVKDEEARRIFPRGTYISVAFNELPRISALTVPLRVSSPPGDFDFPYINTADQSGLLLLTAKRSITKSFTMTSFKLCNAHTGEVISLCERRGRMGLHGNNIGLIVEGQRCVIAELQPKGPGVGRATLFLYSVGDHQWVERELVYSPPLQGRHWFGEGVISNGGLLWWVDLCYGLLACDPFADEPELLYISLPQVLDKLPVEGRINCGAYSCVKLSGGRLMYVQIHGRPDAPVVSTWALADPASAGEWNPERSVCLTDIWSDMSYLGTGLPRSIPALALLHPTDPDKVYFFLGSCIFSVDLRWRKLVEFSEFRMHNPYQHVMNSSRLVHAWQYDPSCSRPSDFVMTRLRKLKEFAAAQSRLDTMCSRHKSAAKLKGSWNSYSRREAMKGMVPTHVFKRSEISKINLNQLASLTLN